MYPLGFKEFLKFKQVWVDTYDRYGWQSYNGAWYNKAKDWYEEYISYGGFPEVVLEQKTADKKELLLDIINSYIELDVKLLSDFTISEELFKLVKLLAARSGNKVDYTKIGSISAISRQKISAYLQLLEQTYLIYQVGPFTKNIDAEISQQKKLYFADTGILNVMAGDQLSSGQIFENAVAAQLKPLRSIQYFQRKTGQEIDFIFKGETAIEVKETPLEQDKRSVRQRASTIELGTSLLVGRYLPSNGFDGFMWGGAIL